VSFISNTFFGNACFHPGNIDWLSTLIGLFFGIALGFLSNKIAKALSRSTPKNGEKKSDHSP
jgi:hypothetical protein